MWFARKKKKKKKRALNCLIGCPFLTFTFARSPPSVKNIYIYLIFFFPIVFFFGLDFSRNYRRLVKYKSALDILHVIDGWLQSASSPTDFVGHFQWRMTNQQSQFVLLYGTMPCHGAPPGQPETFLNCSTIDHSIGTVQVQKERCRSSNRLVSDWWEKSQV